MVGHVRLRSTLLVDPDDPTKGWGIFANISLADQTTNPVHWFLNLGVGGESPLPGRSADSFGVGYYYLATSSVLQQTPGPVPPIRNEQGFELYYNAAITHWFTLAADIQAIGPGQVDARSSFLFGLRAKIDSPAASDEPHDPGHKPPRRALVFNKIDSDLDASLGPPCRMELRG